MPNRFVTKISSLDLNELNTIQTRGYTDINEKNARQI
jgi:hypothetical protein